MRLSIGKRKNVSGNKAVALAALISLVGVALLGYGFTQYRGQAQSLENAENITATITDTGIETDSSRRGGIDYRAEVEFRYSFEGQEYTSDNIYPLQAGKDFDTESAAQDFLENYPEGEAVNAYVNPDNPEGAFLKSQRSNQPVILMVIGGFLMVIGGYNSVKRSI
jgi:hypothetical protein